LSRTRVIVVVSSPADGRDLPEAATVTADRYLAGAPELNERGAIVVNLCRSWRYGSKGYYVSLLADARGQHAIPSVGTREWLADPYTLFRTLQEAGVSTVDPREMQARRRASRLRDAETNGAAPPLVRAAEKGRSVLRPATNEELAETLVFLGTAADPRFRAPGLAVFRECPAPVLRLALVREDGEWKVTQVDPVPPQRLRAPERARLREALADPRAIVRRGAASPRDERRASIAVLFDEDDRFAPSCSETLDRLERVASRMNVHVRRIGLDELHALPEYDALFIRALTGVSEPAFQFALRAEALGMPVVDDPESIIRCSNKVFLEELLRREGIPTPRSRIATRHTPWAELRELGLPLVIKLPDGSFSAAVHRVESEAEYRRHATEMFRASPLILAQEFMPTEFDWRVTVLDGRVLFVARYHMVRGHWQIRSETSGGDERYGRVEAVPRDQAPAEVVEMALRAAALIGCGFYGVDLKETPRGPVVIEVNDNPNLDAGYDDVADGNTVYEDIIGFFLRRRGAGGGGGRPGPGPGAAPGGAHGRAASRDRGATPRRRGRRGRAALPAVRGGRDGARVPHGGRGAERGAAGGAGVPRARGEGHVGRGPGADRVQQRDRRPRLRGQDARPHAQPGGGRGAAGGRGAPLRRGAAGGVRRPSAPHRDAPVVRPAWRGGSGRAPGCACTPPTRASSTCGRTGG
jgi:glutathione synthase/RimK-type ligase-like ATP-grasp enzyme